MRSKGYSYTDLTIERAPALLYTDYHVLRRSSRRNEYYCIEMRVLTDLRSLKPAIPLSAHLGHLIDFVGLLTVAICAAARSRHLSL